MADEVLIPCDLCHGEPLTVIGGPVLEMTCPLCQGRGVIPGVNFRVMISTTNGEYFISLDDFIGVLVGDSEKLTPELSGRQYARFLANRLTRMRERKFNEQG